MMHLEQTTACLAADEVQDCASPPIGHIYEIRPRSGSSGVELISDALPQGRLAFEKQRVAIGYARLHSGSHARVIRIFDADGNLIGSQDHSGAPHPIA